jgi:hypothetical protein
MVSDLIQVSMKLADEMQPQLDFSPSIEALLLVEPQDHHRFQETASILTVIKLPLCLDQ